MSKPSVLYLYHHLGLGDHIISNAIVRSFSTKYDFIVLFCKVHNIESVKFMFRDIQNILIIPVTSDKEASRIHKIIEQTDMNILKIGFENIDRQNVYFDRSFYQQVHIDFEERWNNFKLERDTFRELKLFNMFNVTEGEYIFLHDDKKRSFIIDRSHIKYNQLKIVEPEIGLTPNIFDYCYLLQNAKEIHCIDSSFRLIADSLPLNGIRLVFHVSYIKKDYFISSSKNKWIIV